jgi:hypothetical protein
MKNELGGICVMLAGGKAGNELQDGWDLKGNSHDQTCLS